MKLATALILHVLCFAFCAKPEMQIDGSHTEVSAKRRLADYLEQSIYPDNCWLVKSDHPALNALPTLPGNAAAAAEIVEISAEALKQSSLILTFKVGVVQPGTYSFRSYLQSESGRNLVHAMTTRELKSGTQSVEFLFYGKAIRDAAYAGRFKITGIVGEKLPDSSESASSGALKYWQGSYTTQSYKANAFTNQKFDSQAKREKIKALQKEIAADERKTK